MRGFLSGECFPVLTVSAAGVPCGSSPIRGVLPGECFPVSSISPVGTFPAVLFRSGFFLPGSVSRFRVHPRSVRSLRVLSRSGGPGREKRAGRAETNRFPRGSALPTRKRQAQPLKRDFLSAHACRGACAAGEPFRAGGFVSCFGRSGEPETRALLPQGERTGISRAPFPPSAEDYGPQGPAGQGALCFLPTDGPRIRGARKSPGFPFLRPVDSPGMSVFSRRPGRSAGEKPAAGVAAPLFQ